MKLILAFFATLILISMGSSSAMDNEPEQVSTKLKITHKKLVKKKKKRSSSNIQQPYAWRGFVSLSEELLDFYRIWVKYKAGTLTVEPPRIIQLTGQTGCGKTTWTKAFAQALKVTHIHYYGPAILTALSNQRHESFYSKFLCCIQDAIASKKEGDSCVITIDSFDDMIQELYKNPILYKACNFDAKFFFKVIKPECDLHNIICFFENHGNLQEIESMHYDKSLAISSALLEGSPTHFEKLIKFYTWELQQRSSHPISLDPDIDYNRILEGYRENDNKDSLHPNCILKKALYNLLLEKNIKKQETISQDDLRSLLED